MTRSTAAPRRSERIRRAERNRNESLAGVNQNNQGQPRSNTRRRTNRANQATVQAATTTEPATSQRQQAARSFYQNLERRHQVNR